MRVNPTNIAKRVRQAAIGLSVFVVSTGASGFILALCDEAGWFKKPWQTVAKMIAIAHWLTSNSWVHWSGGIVVGFAIGVWLDDFLRSRAASAVVVATGPSLSHYRAAIETKEQRRDREERKHIIRLGRALIANAMGRIEQGPDFVTELQYQPWFYELRPHLSEQFVRSLAPAPMGSPVFVDCTGTVIPRIEHVFADELDRIEKEGNYIRN